MNILSCHENFAAIASATKLTKVVESDYFS